MSASKEHAVKLLDTIAGSDYMRDVILIAGKDNQR